MSLPEYFEFTISDPKETDLTVVSLKDHRTGYVVRTALSDSERQTPSIMAFVGARYSRSSDSAEDIFKEIKASGKNAQEKLAAIFRAYGHASVADMSELFGYIENIPQLYAFKFFYTTSIGGGQERSTRYQDFSGLSLQELECFLPPDQRVGLVDRQDYEIVDDAFQKLQAKSLIKYNKWVKILTSKFAEVYGVDINNKKQKSALTARVFDTARSFLLNGVNHKTSLAWITSAREWSRIISVFKSSGEFELRSLAEQIEYLFAPDSEVSSKLGYLPQAPDLIKYTLADETTSNVLRDLKNFLVNKTDFLKNFAIQEDLKFVPLEVKLVDCRIDVYSKALIQNILCLYPSCDFNSVWNWVKKLSNNVQKQISEIMFKNFDHHKQMGNPFRVNSLSYEINSSFAEVRDLNRHRAWGRFIPMLEVTDNFTEIFYHGYTLPLYLTDNPKLFSLKSSFEEDLLEYYSNLKRFIDDLKGNNWFPRHLILQLLPFAHNTRFWLHGSVKELSYLTKLRVRPGGHINYRQLAYQMAEISAQSSPLANGLKLNSKPDPSSSEQFFDRS